MQFWRLVCVTVFFTSTYCYGNDFKIELESIKNKTLGWKSRKKAGASGGKVLITGAGHRFNRLKLCNFSVKTPGTYSIWLRYFTDADKKANFYLLLRDRDGCGLKCKKIDFQPRLPSAKPYIKTLKKRIKRKAGFYWVSMHVTFESPGIYSLEVGPLIYGGSGSSRMLDCLIFSDNIVFNPDANNKFSCNSEIKLGAEKTVSLPTGFVKAENYPVKSSFFAGLKDEHKQFHAGLIQNSSIYPDPARLVTLGFNRDHGKYGSPAHEFYTMQKGGEVYGIFDKGFKKKHSAPMGRFVNAEGKTGRIFSISYDPMIKQQLKETAERVRKFSKFKGIKKFRICAEYGGWLDYSQYSLEKFRKWLKLRYKSLSSLNKTWRTNYKDFKAVNPPRLADKNKVAWFDFREFCGEKFVKTVAEQIPIIRKNDPDNREITTQLSNLDLLAAQFTSMRPMDWEQMIDLGLANLDNIGWDGYCADDYMGCEVDLLTSISKGKKLINQEWNIHSTDPRIAARTFWTMTAKGVKGIYLFQFQEGTHHDSYPKWALLNNDFSPKKKLAAYADAIQEIHRFEPLLTSAKAVSPVKPVAIYYSRLDLSLQKKPLACAWGEQIDSPYRVYALLRGLGYQVRWITPKQIQNGGLKKIGAVVFVEANHIPGKAANKIAEWVKSGGAVIGDQWPGICDRIGKTQFTLLNVFGIRPLSKNKKAKGKLALQESTQGYGEETINAIDVDNLHNSASEIWQQWDSKHPVARTTGNFMFSGYGRQNVKCIAGEVVGMTFGGKPGVVINDFGKGHAMYISAMLGSLYGGAASRYEWDPEHSSNSPARLLDAFLKYAGVKPYSETSLKAQLTAKLRVEVPLLSPEGNTFIGLTSFDESPMPTFKLFLKWPKKLLVPQKIMFVSGGNRQMRQLDFTRKGNTISINIPAFDTHAALIGIKNMHPVVSLKFTDAKRGHAALLKVIPKQEITCKAKIFNLSPQPLPAGKIKLFLPQGWLINKTSSEVPPLKPWASAEVEFTLKAPSFISAKRLKPITAKYSCKTDEQSTKSTPCTEIIWWNK